MNARKLVMFAAVLLIGVPFVAVVVAVAGYYALLYTAPRANATLTSSGEEREYLIHVPATLDHQRLAPLVISLHGAASWPGMQERVSRWNALADEKGFIVVYPSGASLTGGRTATGIVPKVWLVTKSGFEKDLIFIRELLDRLEARYRIDPSRVYVEGLSNGGGMAFALSCRMPQRIAAVGAVAAAEVLPFKWCTDQTAMPMIGFHGTADRVVPYAGGSSWSAPDRSYPNMDTWAADWARRNQCAAAPAESRIAGDVVRVRYSGCAHDASVVLFRIEGGGHTWPGSDGMPEWLFGRATRSIDATREMWAFFQVHPRGDKLAPP